MTEEPEAGSNVGSQAAELEESNRVDVVTGDIDRLTLQAMREQEYALECISAMRNRFIQTRVLLVLKRDCQLP